MKVAAITFGNNKPHPQNFEDLENKAIIEIWKHWQETGDYSPAKINFFENGEHKITYITDTKYEFKKAIPQKSNNKIFSEIKNFFKNILKR